MPNQRKGERRRVIRIPVDTVLPYRTVGMDSFQPCDVLNVSTDSMEIVLDHPLTKGAVVTIAAHPDEPGQRSNFIVGEVLRSERIQEKYIHVIKACSARPWPEQFVHNVVASTFNPAPNSLDAYERWCNTLREGETTTWTLPPVGVSLRQDLPWPLLAAELSDNVIHH